MSLVDHHGKPENFVSNRACRNFLNKVSMALNNGKDKKDDNIVTSIRKLVVIGDAGCGKTSILEVFSRDKFPKAHVPTIFENYVETIQVDERNKFKLIIFDTSGSYRFQGHQLYRDEADVVLICFAIDSPDSFDNVLSKWYPHVQTIFPDSSSIPVILVGNKQELRGDAQVIAELAKRGRKPISYKDGEKLAKKIKAEAYMECSANYSQGIYEIFRTAARTSIQQEKNNCSIV